MYGYIIHNKSYKNVNNVFFAQSLIVYRLEAKMLHMICRSETITFHLENLAYVLETLHFFLTQYWRSDVKTFITILFPFKSFSANHPPFPLAVLTGIPNIGELKYVDKNHEKRAVSKMNFDKFGRQFFFAFVEEKRAEVNARLISQQQDQVHRGQDAQKNYRRWSERVEGGVESGGGGWRGGTVGWNCVQATHSFYTKNLFPTSEGVSKVSERANEWAQQRARAKRGVWSKRTSERCERTSKWTS